MNINTGKLGHEQIKTVIENLPVAEKQELTTTTGALADNFKAIVVNNKVVSVLTNKYRLVQHTEAFAPIISSLVYAGITNYNFAVTGDEKRVNLEIYTENARDDKDGVELGFRCLNTFDGRSSIKFDFKVNKAKRWVELVEKDEVTVWGFRQACKNGMMVKVPLAFERVVRAEERAEITELMTKAKNIAHFKTSVDNGLEEVKNIVQAMTLLRKPVERMIEMANQYSLKGVPSEDLLLLIKKYVGKKMSKSIYEQFILDKEESNTLWGLYNAITNIATHRKGISQSTRNKLFEKSADMLEAEIVAMV